MNKLKVAITAAVSGGNLLKEHYGKVFKEKQKENEMVGRNCSNADFGALFLTRTIRWASVICFADVWLQQLENTKTTKKHNESEQNITLWILDNHDLKPWFFASTMRMNLN